MSTINFLVPEKHGHIEIFDITGKLVNRIYININGSNIVWNWTDKMGETLPMGIYTAIYKSNTLKISLRIVKS
jgi:flagellar hook assembly protein FlgD